MPSGLSPRSSSNTCEGGPEQNPLLPRLKELAPLVLREAAVDGEIVSGLYIQDAAEYVVMLGCPAEESFLSVMIPDKILDGQGLNQEVEKGRAYRIAARLNRDSLCGVHLLYELASGTIYTLRRSVWLQPYDLTEDCLRGIIAAAIGEFVTGVRTLSEG